MIQLKENLLKNLMDIIRKSEKKLLLENNDFKDIISLIYH